jgi:hypothetical protein
VSRTSGPDGQTLDVELAAEEGREDAVLDAAVLDVAAHAAAHVWALPTGAVPSAHVPPAKTHVPVPG